jgi:hypothetical protein
MLFRLLCKYIVSDIRYQVQNIAMQEHIIPVLQTSRNQSESGWIINDYVKFSLMMHGEEWKLSCDQPWATDDG